MHHTFIDQLRILFELLLFVAGIGLVAKIALKKKKIFGIIWP